MTADALQWPWRRHWPRGLPYEIDVPATPLGHDLDVAAARFPAKAAIVFADSVLGYGELRARADAIAAHLQQSAGVAHGDRVLLLAQNCPEFVVAFQALLRCGAVVVPVNAMSTAAEMAHLQADSGAEVAVVAAGLLSALSGVALRDVLAFGGGPGAAAGAGARWDAALAAAAAPRPVPASADDVCLLPYTSGTTGRAKGCIHTHRTLRASTTGAVLWRGLHAQAVVLSVAPLFHLLGMQNAMLMPISVGATVVMLPRWDAAAAARLIERHRVTTWAAPPAMLIDFFAHPEAAARDLSSLALLNGGGAAMPEAVSATLAERFGITYIEGYGLTETASFLHCNPLQRPKRQCLGVPTFGVHSRVVDPATLDDVAPGAVGELVTSSRQNMLGYWRDDAANAQAFLEREGRRYLRTGDLASMDGDGYFLLHDRIKRMINVSGYKVWPAEVEARLHEHPAIRAACVVGVPDARQGESVRALVVLQAGATLDAEALVAWCRAHMAVYKAPRTVEFRAALPLSGTGKVLWRDLQDEARGAAGR